MEPCWKGDVPANIPIKEEVMTVFISLFVTNAFTITEI